jgi:hypothetical protein
MDKDNIQILTVDIPTRISINIVHMNDIIHQLRTLPHVIDPNVRAIDIQQLYMFKESIGDIKDTIADLLDEIQDQYETFKIDNASR